jgi:hypothetical protein
VRDECQNTAVDPRKVQFYENAKTSTDLIRDAAKESQNSEKTFAVPRKRIDELYSQIFLCNSQREVIGRTVHIAQCRVLRCPILVQS